MDRILFIVDPQYDFINGSLAVKEAKEKMDALVLAINHGELLYDYIIITKDYHPSNHSSFQKCGGQWPPHCVINTNGALVYDPLWNAISYTEFDMFCKGQCQDREEYSIFENTASRDSITEILLDFELDTENEIRVVGIAGDFCVYHTICDLIELGFGDNLVIDTRFIASIDGGDKLQQLIKNNNLKWQ